MKLPDKDTGLRWREQRSPWYRGKGEVGEGAAGAWPPCPSAGGEGTHRGHE